MFSFKFRPKRLTEKSTNSAKDSENESKASTQPKTPLTGTPNHTSSLDLKFSDHKKPMGVKNATNSSTNCLTPEMAVEDRVAEELERIESWKRMTQMEANLQEEEIKYLKSSVDELTNKLMVSVTEKNRVLEQIKSESMARKEISAEIERTREICNGLKEYVQRIETRIVTFDEIRDSIEGVDDRRSKQYEHLSKQFRELEVKHKTYVSELNTKLNDQKKEAMESKRVYDQMTHDFKNSRNASFKRIQSMESELKRMRGKKKSLETELLEDGKRFEELTQEVNERHVLLANSDQQIRHLKTRVMAKDNAINELETTLRSKAEEIDDKISENEKQMNVLLSEKTRISDVNEDLFKSLISLQIERQELETNYGNEMESLVNGFDQQIKELDSNVESIREQLSELKKSNAENENLIEELEYKANQSLAEKESLEKELKNELKELKDNFESKTSEYLTQISEYETTMKDMSSVNEKNVIKLEELSKETEVLKKDKLSLELKLEREKKSHVIQRSNLSSIVDSCKKDFKNRIEDKDEMIGDYKRELERSRQSESHLSKKCERLEAEKQIISRNLQQLTFTSMNGMPSSPNRVLTPKIMSPIKSSTITGKRFGFSSEESGEEVLSAKQELQERLERRSSQKLTPSLASQEKAKCVQNSVKPNERETNLAHEEDTNEYDIENVIKEDKEREASKKAEREPVMKKMKKSRPKTCGKP